MSFCFSSRRRHTRYWRDWSSDVCSSDLAAEHPVLAVPPGGRPDALEVAAGRRLGHRDGGDQRTAAEAGQPALLLLLGPQVAQVGPRDVVVQAEADARGADPHELLVEDRLVAEVAHAPAAEALLHVGAEEALRAGRGPDLARHDAVALPLVVEGDDVLLGPRPDRLPEVLVLGLVQGSAHGGQCAARHVGSRRLRAGQRSVVPLWTLGAAPALDRFSEPTRAWFTGAFAEPTAAQEGAWQAISSGGHALVVAPTGSGKTLAAFLWSLDPIGRASCRERGVISVVPVSLQK